MHIYDRAYYNYINTGSTRSAEALVPIVTRHLAVRSVADFGAGQGAWLSVWQRLGVSDITALDGAYVDQDTLLVPKHTFVPSDLSGRSGWAGPSTWSRAWRSPNTCRHQRQNNSSTTWWRIRP